MALIGNNCNFELFKYLRKQTPPCPIDKEECLQLSLPKKMIDWILQN